MIKTVILHIYIRSLPCRVGRHPPLSSTQQLQRRPDLFRRGHAVQTGPIYIPQKKRKLKGLVYNKEEGYFLTDSGCRKASSSGDVPDSASRAAVKLPMSPAPARSYNYRTIHLKGRFNYCIKYWNLIEEMPLDQQRLYSGIAHLSGHIQGGLSFLK